MEHQTRFDLNAAVESWRNELDAQPDLTQEDRSELEVHLRDAITELLKRGLNEEESFWLARRRVGRPRQLGEEFTKADPGKIWRERIFWIALASLLTEFWNRTTFNVMMYLVNLIGNANATLFREVLFFAPILWIIFCLVTGRMGRIGRQLNALFHARSNLVGALVFVAVLFIAHDCLLVHEHRLVVVGGVLSRIHNIIYEEYAVLLIRGGIFYGTIIGLIAWLMPQGREAAKPNLSISH